MSNSSDNSASTGRRFLRPEWPVFDIMDTDCVDYDDDVSVSSVDMSIWKSAPTDNEAPPIISKKELRTHRTVIDAWIAIQGIVYDVTTFLDRHPGGSFQLMRGVGRDATKLFAQIHPYVDVRKYVGGNCVGVYIPSGTSLCSLKNVVSKIPQEISQDNLSIGETDKKSRCWFVKRIMPKSEDPEKRFQLRFTQNEYIAVLLMKAPMALKDESIGPDCWTFVICDNKILFIKVIWTPQKCWVGQYRLNRPIDCEYLYVSFKKRNEATVMIPKNKAPGQSKNKWGKFGMPELVLRNCTVQDPFDVDFDDSTRALLFYRTQLTPKVILYGFKLRPSSYFGIPMGYSVVLTVNDYAARVYPTTFTMLGVQEPICEIKGQTFYFMISLDFYVTSALNELRSMNETEMLEATYTTIGYSKGDFQWNLLDNVDTLVLLAQGIGIAPLSRVLRYFQAKHPEQLKHNHVLLMYFNHDRSEIIWHEELVEASAHYPWFHLFVIVEQADATWDQLIGTISTHLVKWCMNAVPGVHSGIVSALASGNKIFLDACQGVFQNMQDVFDSAAVFDAAKEVSA